MRIEAILEFSVAMAITSIAHAQAPGAEEPAPAPTEAAGDPGADAAEEPGADGASSSDEPGGAPGSDAASTRDAAPPTIQLAPPAEAATGKIHLTPQTTTLDGPRTFHNHDGFYLRMNLGLGHLWGTYDRSGPNSAEIDASGSGLGVDLLIGGSPSPGFVVGGGILGNWLFSADFEQQGDAVTGHDIGSGLVGVFVDGFPRATGGWHLGGFLGVGGQTLSDDAAADETGGLGLAVFAGYDQWVGDDFSVGGLLRFTAARSTGEKQDADITASTATLGLMFSALYH
jgi:hypothetical protein